MNVKFIKRKVINEKVLTVANDNFHLEHKS